MQNSSPPPLHPMPTSNSTADDSGFNINLNSFTLVMLMGVLMYSLMLSLVHRKLSILHARSKDLNIIKLFVCFQLGSFGLRRFGRPSSPRRAS